MNKDRFGLMHLTNQKDAKDQAEGASIYFNQNGQFNKTNAIQFLDAILNELTSNQTSPISKTMTLHLLKQLTYQSEVKFMSMLMSHETLNFLQKQAKTIDPKKNLNDKGLKKFPNSPQLGRQYMRVLLELLNFWGEKYAKGSNTDTPTKFKRYLSQLKETGVVLPSNYEYLDPNEFKLRSKRTRQSANISTGLVGTSSQPNKNTLRQTNNIVESSITPKPGNQNKILSQLVFVKEKINIFIEDLQSTQDPIKIQTLINTNHSFFQKQLQNNQRRKSDLQSEQIITDVFAIQHFLTEQNRFYQQYMPKNDFRSYITQVKIVQQTTFQQGPPIKKPVVQSKPKSQMPLNEDKLYGTSNLAPTQSSRTGTFNQKPGDTSAIINKFYTQLSQRSQSPHTGFKSFQNQLQKQKLIAKNNPIRRTSRSPRNLSRSNDGNINKSYASGLRQSKIHPIFSNPPNRTVEYKNFEGQTLRQNQNLIQALYGIKKQQGSRRFKVSNFKQKKPLFENEQIQVGYKTQVIYDRINDFTRFIMINLFIGNKTEDDIKQLQVQYKADQNQVLYANPRNIGSIIPAGFQNKHDLMISPLAVPYALMTMHIRYKFKDTGYMTSIVLPNSVLKFATYPQVRRQQLQSNWHSAKIYKTKQFRLCRHIAPDSFSKWIPNLVYLTEYSQFAKQKSTTDLQMLCMVKLLNQYSSILKIIVRPNLQVILQIGVLPSNQEAIEYFKFYLETMELMLKDTDI